MLNILPENLVLQRSVPIYAITQLGLRSHPTWSSTLEALSTLSFIRSDKPFFNTPAFRNCSPCYPTQAVAEPIVSHIRNPYLTFPGGVHHFHRRLKTGLGRSHGGFSDCGCMDPFRTRAPHQCTGAQGGNIGPQSLGNSITGPSCFDSADNTTVVAYINKQGGTHSHLLLRLVVDLFQWFQTQDITLRARHISGCLNVIADRLSRPSQPIMTEWSLHPEVVNLIFRLWGTPVVDRFATVHNTHLLQFMALVPEPRALAIDALSQDWQERSMYMFPPFLLLNSHSEAQDHPDGRTHRPLMAVTTVVSTPAMIECGSSAMILSVPQRPFVTTGLHYISSGKSYHLHAWRLLCSTTKQQDFQGRSLSLLQLLHVGDPPQIECTMTGGYASLPGLQGEDLIRLSRVTGPV